MDDASARNVAGDDCTAAGAVCVALVVDEFVQPAWVVEALEEAVATGRVHFGVVLVPSSSGEGSFRTDAAQWGRRALHSMYDAFDRGRFLPETSPFETRDMRPIVGPCPAWPLVVAGDDTAEEALRRSLREAGVDVLLNLTREVKTSTLAGHARLGAAAFVFGTALQSERNSVGFDEVVSAATVISVRLELWSGRNGTVTRVVESVTNVHPFSAGRTRALAARHAVTMVGRLAGELLLDAVPASGRLTEGKRSPRHASQPHERRHSTVSLLFGLARLGMRYARYLATERGLRDQWVIAYSRDATGAESGSPELRLSRYRQVVPPNDRFWADPFPLRVDGRDYIIVEELLFAEQLGHISVIELGADGILGPPVTVLERPFHLSYPFTFSHDGELYLLPEMAEEGRLELYRATRPPYEWVLDRVLVEGPMLVDATLQEIDGRWWMFACEYRPGLSPWTDLLLFHSDSPLGPWTPHRRNPVVSDVRFARPAGRLFRSNGAWMRPAQDCSRSYGEAMSLRRIVRITPTDYHEVEEQYLAAGGDSGMRGPHTINRAGDVSTIDLKRRVRR